MSKNRPEKDIKEEKWEFEDYAFTITGIIVGFLLVVPEILYIQFDISILGGSMSETQDLFEGIEDGIGTNGWNIIQLRTFSPLLFLITITIAFFKDALDARKSGRCTGSLFEHTLDSLFEDSIYMAITTIMVFGTILFGAVYASWLAGPITWILFVFLFPLIKKKSCIEDEETHTPWICLFIFIIGIIAEVITGAWIAFPLSWLIICAIKFVGTIREKINSIDAVFDFIYYAFSIILLSVGLIINFWLMSWLAFPIAIFICWVLSKFGKFKKVKADTQ